MSAPKTQMLAVFEEMKPPPGFVKKEYLGAGAWKVAFRASSPASLVDVALLCYHGENTQAIAEDVSKLVKLKDVKDQFSRYITRVHNIHFDDDGRIWIAEELLTEPLAALAPLSETRTFCEIARDLSRAIAFIHSKNLVHRDMKLDNCGVDVDAQVAKIFDVGSVTSEFSSEMCTILTRGPEFLRSDGGQEPFTKEGDIWGLGATLFALRTGRYPFVTAEEARERALLGERLAMKQITKEQYQDLKRGLDAQIVARAEATDAEQRLIKDMERHWSEGALRVMKEMLAFDRTARRDANYFQEAWSLLADDFMKPAEVESAVSPQRAICDFLKAVEAGDILATPAQVERCGRRLDRYRKEMSDKEYNRTAKLVQRTKRRVETYWKRNSRSSA